MFAAPARSGRHDDPEQPLVVYFSRAEGFVQEVRVASTTTHYPRDYEPPDVELERTGSDITAIWNHALALVVPNGAGDGAIAARVATLRVVDLAVARVSESACVGRCAASVLIDPMGQVELERFAIVDAERAIRLYAGGHVVARTGLLRGADGFTLDDGDNAALWGLAPSLEAVRVETIGAAVTTTAP